MHLLVILGLFTDRNDRFSYRFIYVNKGNPNPFIYLRAEKDTPFGRIQGEGAGGAHPPPPLG